MQVVTFTFGSLGTNCYIAFCDKTKAAVLIDVADNVPTEYFEEIKKLDLDITHILLTHGHYDHCAGVSKAKTVFPKAKVCISAEDYTHIADGAPHPFVSLENFVKPDILLDSGDVIDFGEEKLTVLLTPGHTSGGCIFYDHTVMFSGDTIFKCSIGRTDFYSGNTLDIIRSVTSILSLSGNRYILSGHGNSTTQDYERKYNPYYKNYE